MSKITTNQLGKICGINPKTKVEIPYKISDEETIIVTFKTELPFLDMDALVNKIVDSVFTADGEYLHTYRDVIFFGTILKALSNIPVPEKKIIDEDTGVEFKVMDLEKIWFILNQSKLMDKIYEMYNSEVEAEKELYYFIAKLENMVADMIEYRKQQILSKKESKLDEVFENLNNLVLTITDKIGDFDLASLAEYVPQIASAISEGKFDSNALVKAFINAKGSMLDSDDINEQDTKEFDNIVNFNRDVDGEEDSVDTD